MAIETQPEQAHGAGGAEPAGPRPRPWWMRPAIHTAIIGAVIGYLLGHLLGNFLASNNVATEYPNLALSDSSDWPIVLGYGFAIVGWMIGLGVFGDLFRQMIGRPVRVEAHSETEDVNVGVAKYFRFTLDHKVVGIQYLVGMVIYFCTAGLFAMAIRAELLSPTYHLFSSATYVEIVGEHGTMMMMLMSSVILGPFGNYLVPLMIGSKRVAFPRLEALSFWLTPMAFLILLSGLMLGGFPFGWTGYAPLSIQSTVGADSYAMAFGLMGFSIILAGFNIIVTVICYRAPGMRWSRIPIFVWSIVATSFLMVLAAPVLVGGMYMMITDRTAQTAFFIDTLGGSSYLYQNLFWFFGHPEVYILALPGFGIVLEILPVFCRKPLWGYRLAVAGMFGVALLSFMVWQHHLFVSGINANLRPFYMFTTELISIPTGLIFLNAMGTLWRAKIRFTVPMLFALSFFFNFLIGGVAGVFLSDVPSDVTTHGSYFVMAHFHSTIMGGLVFALVGGIYYWLPKFTGFKLNEKLGKVHFWTMFVFFNLTFFPLFAAGMLGMPRRVSSYNPSLHGLNVFVSVAAFCLGASMLILLVNLVWSLILKREKEVRNPWHALSLEWQLPSPPPVYNFEEIPVINSGPYDYGVPDRVPVADLKPSVTGSGIST